MFGKSVKMRIISIMVAFTLLISFIVGFFAIQLMRNFQERRLIQSMEASLSLVAGNLRRDFVDMVGMAAYYSRPTGPAGQYFTGEYSDIAAANAYRDFSDYWLNNRLSRHIYRAIAIRNDSTRILHIGTGAGTSSLVTNFYGETLDVLSSFSPYPSAATLYPLQGDVFSRSDNLILPLVASVYSSYKDPPVGVVYIAVNKTLFTHAASGLTEENELFLTIDSQHYRVTSRTVEPVEGLPTTSHLVEEAVRPGVSLTLTVPTDYRQNLSEWMGLLVVILFVIAVTCLLMIVFLNYYISKPVEQISRKISAISRGDFSYDASIESDSEIGQVGQGINQLSASVADLMETRLADEQRKQHLEYRALQNQINPHFLYNTLNSIKWMATFQKADGIAEMVTALSHLLKTVAKDLRQTVTLGEEISLLDDYFIIMKYRYGGAISFEKQIAPEDEGLLAHRVPRFILQPLMENAIFHGLEPKGRGTLRLTVACEGEDVAIRLWDNGMGIEPERIAQLFTSPPEEEGARSVGIVSVHERLRYVFGPAYGLTIESKVGEYTEMIIRVPNQPIEKEA